MRASVAVGVTDGGPEIATGRAPRGVDEAWPTVSVIVPTHQRPELVRRAVASIVEQDYPGRVDVIVVFDRCDVDRTVERMGSGVQVIATANTRTPGLAGARNSGIICSQGDLVAFCDDDDAWEPGKLTTQVAALLDQPDAEFATTAMVVDFQGRSNIRLAGKDRVGHLDLLRSRMAMLHSSSFVIWRSALIDGIGLVDETLPQSMAEDWDLLLRAADRQPIVHVDQPLVRIQWGGSSYFVQQWQVRNDAQLWLLEHHPEMGRDPIAAGLSYGKLAFGAAALGRRREALGWAARALRARWREPRAVLALAVCAGLRWEWVARQLNARGHGI